MRARNLGFRPYRVGDAHEFDARGDFARERTAFGPALGLQDAPPGLSWTVTRDGEAVAVGGFAPASEPGVWDAWAVLSDLSPRDMARAVQRARKVVAYFDREVGAPLEATALHESGKARRTLARLGFAPVRVVRFRPELPDYLLFRREAR